MSVQVQKLPAGMPLTNGGRLTTGGAEALDRIVRAVEALQDQTLITSPNGTVYRLTVDDAGNLSTTAI